MIRSALSYLHYFANCAGDGSKRRLLLAHHERPSTSTTTRAEALDRAVNWLFRAQDQTPDAGISSYHLVHGWGAPYPETTGYTIPTLIAVSELRREDGPTERALRAANWLLSIQQEDGGWQGGRIGEDRPSIAFNTAQVIRGLLAAHHVTHEQKFLDASVRAAEWIISGQSRDGAFRRNNFLGVARVYDSYVCAPLLHLHRITDNERYKRAAEHNLEWILAQQWINGWFSNADNTVRHNDRPITHTIAYTIDGLIECSAHVNHDVLINQSRKAADALLEQFNTTGWLNGRYSDKWVGSEDLITTGSAQSAIAWHWLARITGDAKYLNAASRMTDLLIAIQDKSAVGPADCQGALPGSFPLWGRYEKFAFPNWGTKYFVDLLLCGEGRLPVF